MSISSRVTTSAPNAERVSHNAGETIIDKLWSDFDHRWRDEKAGYQEAVAPYINAIGYASVLLSAERSLEEACASFLDLPQADFCYVLDAAGQQIGTNLYAQVHPACDIRFAPLADAQSARWARRPYFRRALETSARSRSPGPTSPLPVPSFVSPSPPASRSREKPG